MVSKIVTTIGGFAVKKLGNATIKKAVEQVDKPFAAFNREVLGIKPLNVGEEEELSCFRQYPNDIKRCEKLGQKIRDEYRQTGKYNPYSKKK